MEDITKKKKSKVKILLIIILIIAIGYATVVFVPIPIIRDMRNIYIATAMTTAHHKYLATLFFPKYIIDDVMSEKVDIVDIVSDKIQHSKSIENDIDEYLYNEKEKQKNDRLSSDTYTKATESDILTDSDTKVISTASDLQGNFSKGLELNETYKNNYNVLLNKINFPQGSPDYNGNLILVNNEEEQIVIIEVKELNYTGYLAIVGDPSRVALATTKNKDKIGQSVPSFLRTDNGILGINASGFPDVDGKSAGGDITGLCYSGGIPWGEYKDNYMSLGFDIDNNFIVGLYNDWAEKNIRDGIQFKPAVLINGFRCNSGGSGWGLQPRTAIGQDANGMVYLLVIDGRKVGHSIGASVDDVANIFMQYGVVNAAFCDGGSSAAMAYDGKLFNIPSTPMKEEGRYVPNAFIVKKLHK